MILCLLLPYTMPSLSLCASMAQWVGFSLFHFFLHLGKALKSLGLQHQNGFMSGNGPTKPDCACTPGTRTDSVTKLGSLQWHCSSIFPENTSPSAYTHRCWGCPTSSVTRPHPRPAVRSLRSRAYWSHQWLSAQFPSVSASFLQQWAQQEHWKSHTKCCTQIL